MGVGLDIGRRELEGGLFDSCGLELGWAIAMDDEDDRADALPDGTDADISPESLLSLSLSVSVPLRLLALLSARAM